MLDLVQIQLFLFLGKIFLQKLKDGDSGSTVLGYTASLALTANINFSDLFSSDENRK